MRKDLRVKMHVGVMRFEGGLDHVAAFHYLALPSLRSKGVDPANANGTNVIAALEDLKKRKANALAEIERATTETVS